MLTNIKFTTLDEVNKCYGKENMVAISCLKQIIFYTSHGCQPKFINENENKPGKIVAWFFRPETNYVYRKWMDNRDTV